MPSLQPATPDFLETAPFRVVTDVTVMAPIDTCWALLADQASWVQWFDGMSAVKATPWLWTEPGQTRTVTINGMSVDETAISIVPEVEYAFTINKWLVPGFAKAAEAVRLQDRTNGGSPRTTLTYIGALEPTALGQRLETVFEKQLSEAWKAGLKSLGEFAARKANANA